LVAKRLDCGCFSTAFRPSQIAALEKHITTPFSGFLPKAAAQNKNGGQLALPAV
jgi:hypothetical protein